jgi:tRNA threonylcarbamoyladenosine modification (KEOPS) complex  Pcc1 subunit
MLVEANLRLKFSTAENAAAFLTSFMPEAANLPMKRSRWTINQQGSDIIFEIQSEDAVAFRATINSFLQFAHGVEKTIDVVEESI